MKIRSVQLAPVIVVAFVVGIGLTMAFNLWITESNKIPATYISGEFAGEYNPGDIRGSYSFGDIQEAFGVPVTVLSQAFGLVDEKNAASFQVKGLEESYGSLPDGGEVGTDSVRLFTALYIGRPYTPEETTLLPAPALSFLKEKLAPADLEALREKSVQLSELRLEEGAVVEEHVETDERLIKGKTTFGDLLSWGLSKEEIEGVIGLPIGSRATTVRDYLIDEGVEFSVYKTALQELVDSK